MKKLQENLADWYAKKIIDYIFKLNDDDLFIFYSFIAFELKRRFKERDDYLNCLKQQKLF